MKIFLTGASGYIGNRMAEVLLKKDWVTGVVGTDISAGRINHPKYTFYQRDIRENMDDIFEKENIDAIIHAAYVLTPIHDKGKMEDINKNGSQNILSAGAKAGVRQILYLSSTTAYGFHPDNDQLLLEDSSPLRGNDDFTYSKNKKELEPIFSKFAETHPDITVSVLRPCMVVGPGWRNPTASALMQKVVVLPANTKPWQFVHEDDLINIMALLLEKRIGGVYNVAGDGTMTFKEMVDALGNKLVTIPWALLYPMNNLFWHLRMTSIAKAPSSGMRMLMHPWIASNEKIKKETGYKFQYDTKAAFAEFVKSTK